MSVELHEGPCRCIVWGAAQDLREVSRAPGAKVDVEAGASTYFPDR